ncbi:peptide chain release factor N(5)-glutamine methyltransferase [Peptoniphilus raoultii]|uniref:peptide chain release factor N(5)-glutamine methyltransferase n=1 Tax=Peptoniphilus raoultii TaxID=1776387 RepID=UPI0008D90EE3|nr:peptide chain release factor N(5)-glutamine methyltransferase [Peptoniphilus raoultii]
MKIKEALEMGKVYLKGREYTDPSRESTMILLELLNKDYSFLEIYREEELTKEIEDSFFDILERRRKGEPLQYIMGKANFMGYEFKVYPGVLIPRQDTELSLEYLLKIINGNAINSMLDLGCGSGIVGIMVNKLTNIEVHAIDINDLALKNTEENARKFGTDLKIYKSNLFSKVKEKFDIIYSNPPYIKTKDIEKLQVEVREYEPRNALDGGEDGLYYYREIIKNSSDFLNPFGYLVFEISFDQKEDLEKLMKDEFYLAFKKDLQGFDRIVIAKRRC